MTSIYTWSTSASSNATADSAINWAEFQAPDTVNNSARQMMGRVAELLGDLTPVRTLGGSANAYTATTTSSPAGLVNGLTVCFVVNATNTGSSTLAVNAFGAKPLRAKTGTNLGSGELQAGTVCQAYYNLTADEWLIVNSGFHVNALVPALIRSSLSVLPVGSVLAWTTNTVPTGWLECNGAAVSRTTYPQLFSALGTIYGAGDGSTTFNLPDYRGEFLRGQANGSANDPDAASRTNRGDGTTGDAVGTKQAADTAAHTHGPGTLAGTTNTTGAHTHTVNVVFGGVNSAAGGAAGSAGSGPGATGNSGDHSHTVTLSSGVTGSTGGTETRPRNVAVKYIILALPTGSAINGDVVLANGLNSNVATSSAGKLRITGPTGAFSVGGLTAGADGDEVKLYNTTSQAMTIVNEDTSSTSTNRILTLTGGNVTLRTGTSFATLTYDLTSARWILSSTN